MTTPNRKRRIKKAPDSARAPVF